MTAHTLPHTPPPHLPAHEPEPHPCDDPTLSDRAFLEAVRRDPLVSMSNRMKAAAILLRFFGPPPDPPVFTVRLEGPPPADATYHVVFVLPGKSPFRDPLISDPVEGHA
jgi:hypothetical protein